MLCPGVSSRSIRSPCHRNRFCSVSPLISACLATRRPRLGIGVPPQVLGLEVGIDDRMRQAVLTVEVLGLVAQRVDLGDQVAFAVVAGRPHAAIREAGFGAQRRGEVVLVADRAAQRVGFLHQPAEVVVLEYEVITD